MNVNNLVNLLVSTGVLGVIGWTIKRTIDSAIRRWTERIVELERRMEQAHVDIDDLREKKVAREDFIRETARNTRRFEKLLEGQALMMGRMGIAPPGGEVEGGE